MSESYADLDRRLSALTGVRERLIARAGTSADPRTLALIAKALVEVELQLGSRDES